ncbi:Uncharacterised protein [BD1-7 clade bacterium]|uniref:Type VI secretion system-associated protein n=1 Tax=BD1-7 clade bacterium TaxID=2029982 RepID=A0A5S9QWL6_9GAMM|nr:Uncharacterised protein [BD1-7 clade bacterium]
MANNKVIWTEGLLLKPAHFQQQERYFEDLIHQHSRQLQGFEWGFDVLELDTELLSLNKIGIKRARGILPDGAVFDIPETDSPPPVVELPDSTVHETLLLCLPLRNDQYEYRLPKTDNAVQRYQGHLQQIDNTSSTDKDEQSVLVASLRFAIKPASDNTDGYCVLPFCRILECSKNRGIVLDENFIPPILNSHNNDILHQQLTNLTGFLVKKTVELVGRIHANTESRYNNFEIEDLLCLQTINHYTPLLHHLAEVPVLHPELYYRYLLMMVSELSTYTQNRTLKQITPYLHDNLYQTFEQLYNIALECIANISSRVQVVEITINKANFGLYHALISNKEVLQEARFILAVKAEMPAAELRKEINERFRISTVETIKELVVANLPGFRLHAMSRVPRDLPFHEGYVYFELEMNESNRMSISHSTGFAMQVGGDTSNMRFQFWAVIGDLYD